MRNGGVSGRQPFQAPNSAEPSAHLKTARLDIAQSETADSEEFRDEYEHFAKRQKDKIDRRTGDDAWVRSVAK